MKSKLLVIMLLVSLIATGCGNSADSSDTDANSVIKGTTTIVATSKTELPAEKTTTLKATSSSNTTSLSQTETISESMVTTVVTTTQKETNTTSTAKTTTKVSDKKTVSQSQKPATTTQKATTTKKSTVTTAITQKPNGTESEYCEGFGKLWGKSADDLRNEHVISDDEYSLFGSDLYWSYSTGPWEYNGNIGWKICDNIYLFETTIPVGCCYSYDNTISLSYATDTGNVYGFALDMYPLAETGCESCPDFDVFYERLTECYGEPDKSEYKGELEAHLWNKTLDGDIFLFNYTEIDGYVRDSCRLFIYDSEVEGNGEIAKNNTINYWLNHLN